MHGVAFGNEPVVGVVCSHINETQLDESSFFCSDCCSGRANGPAGSSIINMKCSHNFHSWHGLADLDMDFDHLLLSTSMCGRKFTLFSQNSGSFLLFLSCEKFDWSGQMIGTILFTLELGRGGSQRDR